MAGRSRGTARRKKRANRADSTGLGKKKNRGRVERKEKERERDWKEEKDRFRWKPNVPELNCGITATSDAEFILGLDGVVWRCYVVISGREVPIPCPSADRNQIATLSIFSNKHLFRRILPLYFTIA